MQTCEGIFVDYVDISFQVNLSAYIQYASIVEDSLYKVNVLDNLRHSLQRHAFVMVYSVGLELALFICATTASI